MNCCDTCIDMCKLIAVNINGTAVHVNEKLNFILKRKVILFSFVVEHPLETILLRITENGNVLITRSCVSTLDFLHRYFQNLTKISNPSPAMTRN